MLSHSTDVPESIFSISNLHCGSCVQTIESTLASLVPPPLSFVVSLAFRSVIVRHDPCLPLALIRSSIEDAGFDVVSSPGAAPHSTSTLLADKSSLSYSKHIAQCYLCEAERKAVLSAQDSAPTLLEKRPVNNPVVHKGPYRLSLSIGGMTCAACSSTITRLVSEINGVSNVVVDLIGHSANVIIENEQLDRAVVDAIEYSGYEAEIVKLESLSNDTVPVNSVKSRVISLRVDGMTCQHCVPKVMAALEPLHDKVTVLKRITSHTDPILELSYTPSPPFFTIRTIISALSPSPSFPFTVSIYHPPTLEERAQRMRNAEQRKLLFRLGFSILVAIPTFIIGIVYMSLVPDTNPTKRYLIQPILNGMASRMEWALFFLATPVMFYSAGLFHQRSIKEVRSIWRKGNKTPIWMRFVRFGSMNLLVSAGVSVAYFSSIVLLALSASQRPSSGQDGSGTTTYFDSVVFLTMFLLCGRYLEAYSKGRTADAVGDLRKLQPSQALLLSTAKPELAPSTSKDSASTDLESGIMDIGLGTQRTSVEPINTSMLEVGDVVRVGHGSTPPADGVIVSGETFFDESSLTGESRPVRKAVGDRVFLGTINQGKVADVKIDVVGGQTMLDNIVEIVREGHTHRAPIERVADLITGYLVPVVILLTIITWVIWLSLGLSGALPRHYLDIKVGGWTVWSLQFAVAVFVVACPCGIGLAAPTALLVGSGLAAKYGILVRGGGEAFQECAQLDIVVFDKTGTLTEGGEPQVTDTEFVGDRWERELLFGLACEIETASSHPIAGAIRGYCQANGVQHVSVSEVEEIPGMGLRATVSGSPLHEVIVGNLGLMEKHKTVIASGLLQRLESWQGQGKSVVIMAVREEKSFIPVMAFAISDTLRENARVVISSLQDSGLGTWMLSGDNPTTAKAVARLVGIPETNVIAGVLPHEKAQRIQWLQQVGLKRPLPRWRRLFARARLNERCIVAMVGDGINDAAALTAADVGIAIGSGSDVAISSASFVLLSSDLKTLLTLTDLSRTVFNRVKMNFAWAGVYNIIAIPIAAGVIYPIGNARLSPVWASLAMALSSVSVVCSSLMLKLYKEPKL